MSSVASTARTTTIGMNFTENLLREGWFHPECPLSRALPPLLQALGWKGNVRQLIDALPGRAVRLDVAELRAILALLGYHSYVRKGHLREVSAHSMPLLFIPDNDDPLLVVLKRVSEGYLVHDCMAGQVVTVEADDDVGHYLRFELTEQVEVADPNASWFVTTLRRFRATFRDVLWLGLAINSFALVVPFFTMMVYDRVIGAHVFETLYYLLAGAALALVAETFFRLARGVLLGRFGARLNHLVACGIFSRFLELEPATAEQVPPASQIARVRTFESVREFFTGQNFILFIELPFLLVILLVLVLLSPAMAAVCGGIGVLFALLISAQMRHLRERSTLVARATADRQAAGLEIFTKLEALHVNGFSDPLLKRFDRLSQRAARHSASFSYSMHVMEHLASALGLLGGLIAISVGLSSVWAGSLTPGGLIAGMILVWRILGPLQQLAAVAPRLRQVWGAIEQIDRLLALPSEHVRTAESYQRHSFEGNIELVNVAMRYGRNDPIFSGVAFNVKAGQMVAVAGGNGSGKSSLLKLINGMYRQAAGSIRIDGIDIRQLDALALRRSVTYIPQAVTLFSGTVRENVALASPLASDDRIREALDMFGALEDIRQLPSGLDTVIGPQGINLPEIFAFKIMLARAFLDPKPIILCDELPYAVLNSQTGERFRRLLAQLRGRRTIILATHTEDLIDQADQVVFLRQERRHAIGNPREIIPLLKERIYG